MSFENKIKSNSFFFLFTVNELNNCFVAQSLVTFRTVLPDCILGLYKKVCLVLHLNFSGLSYAEVWQKLLQESRKYFNGVTAFILYSYIL